MALAVKGIQHLNLRVADLARARAFYVELLGFRVAFAKGDTVWLEAGGDLLGLSEGAVPARSFEHFGFMVDAPGEVDRWAERCASARRRGREGTVRPLRRSLALLPRPRRAPARDLLGRSRLPRAPSRR